MKSDSASDMCINCRSYPVKETKEGRELELCDKCLLSHQVEEQRRKNALLRLQAEREALYRRNTRLRKALREEGVEPRA
jgi:Zn-finger protein